MLSKLLKYEFRDTARVIPFFYLIVLTLTVMVFTSKQLEIGWFIVTSSTLLIIFGIATVVITFVLIVLRFYRNLYSNEGYLMFTLPVKPVLLLASKVIVSYIWIIAGCLIAFGSICISLYGFGVGKSEFDDIIFQMQIYGLEKIVYAIIPVFLLSALYLLAQIFFSITFANRPALHGLGIGAAFLVFLATYVILQVVQAIFTIFVPFSINIGVADKIDISLANNNMFEFFMENISGNIPERFVVGLGGYVFIAVMVCVLFYITSYMMKRKVSIK